jgi:hypothetical protein
LVTHFISSADQGWHVDHQYIEEHNIVSLYSMGKLPTHDRRRFEEHFMDCTRCLDQIDLVDELRRGLKQVAAEDATEAGARASRPAWLALLRGWKWVATAAAASVLVTLPVLLSQIGRLRNQLESTKLASLGLERRLELQQHANVALQQQLQERQMPAGTAVFLMSTMRGADSSSEPENRITFSSSVPWVTLSIERDHEAEYRDYRATLSDAKGRTVWQQEHLAPAPPAAMGIILPSNLFHTGDYELKLEGVTRDARYFPAAHFRIRARLTD